MFLTVFYVFERLFFSHFKMYLVFINLNFLTITKFIFYVTIKLNK